MLPTVVGRKAMPTPARVCCQYLNLNTLLLHNIMTCKHFSKWRLEAASTAFVKFRMGDIVVPHQISVNDEVAPAVLLLPRAPILTRWLLRLYRECFVRMTVMVLVAIAVFNWSRL